MKTKIHAIAGGIGFLTILSFWTSTVFSELFLSHEAIASVKAMILWGMFILIPAMAIAGGSGMAMGKARTDRPAVAKKKRMPIIAANGLLILLPSAFYLAGKAAAGEFDGTFYAVQALELVAGAANLVMMGLNIRDGLTMTGKIASPQPTGVISEAIIEARENGPLVAKGVTRLTGTGVDAKQKPVLALCRCGASKNKPFCDGTHTEIGFDSAPPDSSPHDKLRDYTGKDITVHYNRLLCSHAAECGRRLPAVFDSKRRPWIVTDNASADAIQDVVAACPSGALSYSLPGQSAQHALGEDTGITIEKNGPYRVTGIALADARSAEGGSSDKYVLCRCGASKNKPFCDGTHAEINWKG